MTTQTRQDKALHISLFASSQVNIQQLSVAVAGLSGLSRKKDYKQDRPEEPNNPWSCLIRATENRQSHRKRVQDIYDTTLFVLFF